MKAVVFYEPQRACAAIRTEFLRKSVYPGA